MKGKQCYDFSPFKASLLTSDISSTDMSWGKYVDSITDSNNFIIYGNDMLYD
jgi:hypothetical protein